MKKEKIGLTTTNWILSILGIILFSCFIILPPVFRVVFKEEAKTPEEETVYPNITTICYKDKISGIEYIDNEKISFQHQNSKIKQITKEISRKYNDPLIYQQKKQSYGVLVTAFSIISGYSYSITPNDNDANIQIIETYDLTYFTPTMIVVPGDTEPTSIKSDYELDESIINIKEKLTASGYYCSENS